MALEFWIWRERGGFILFDSEHRLEFHEEAKAIDAAVRIAQDSSALYRIIYARHVPA
jgi:hypothetical protein